MPSVVAEGRRVLANIERVSDLFLTKSIYAGVLALMTGVATMPFPFLPRHLTVITALTIGIPGFFLALMPNTQRFRAGFLSRVLRFTIPAGVVAATTTFGSYYTALATAGGTETAGAIAAAQVSGAVTLFCVALTVLLLVARPWNPLRLAIVAASGVGFVLAMLIPFISNIFALTPGSPASTVTALVWGAVGAGLVCLIRLWSERARRL
jgi:cation-transporting ATPase E